MSDSAVTVRVRVTPRGGRTAVIGWRARDETLLMRVAAPPVDGAANKACVELIAITFGLKKSQVTLIAGATTRDKRFTLDGITIAQRDAVVNGLPTVSTPDT